MSDFTGNNIKDTYSSILNVGTSSGCCLPGTSTIIVTDGVGQQSALSLGQQGNGASISGPLQTTGAGANITANGQVTADSICQTGSTGSLAVDGDFFVGPPAARTITADNATGLITTCGPMIIGGSCSTTDQTIGNCGSLVNKGIIYGCDDIIAFSSSDKNLKENINRICNTQDILHGLNGYNFTWKVESGRKGDDLGVIAQEVKDVLPGIVHQREDGYLAVDYIKLIPVLIEEVKRLSKEVDELKK